MSALMEQHERWAEARERLWPIAVRAKPHAFIPPPPPDRPPITLAEAGWQPPFNFYSPPGHMAIVRLVAAKHGLDPWLLLSKARFKPIIAARDEALGLVYTHCRTLSLPALGRIFHRDHTTILSALRKMRKQNQPVYRNNIANTVAAGAGVQ